MAGLLKGSARQLNDLLTARYKAHRNYLSFAASEWLLRFFTLGFAMLLTLGGGGRLWFAWPRFQENPGEVYRSFGLLCVAAVLLLLLCRPRYFACPDPKENLNNVAEACSIVQAVANRFPEMELSLGYSKRYYSGVHNERCWSLEIGQEKVERVTHQRETVEQEYDQMEQRYVGPQRIGSTSVSVQLTTFAFTIRVDGEVEPRGMPDSEHLKLLSAEKKAGRTAFVLALPRNHSERQGLGHDGRTVLYVNQPGRHHPEWVGELAGLSLLWALGSNAT